MNMTNKFKLSILAPLLAAVVLVPYACAKKPDNAGGGKGQGNNKTEITDNIDTDTDTDGTDTDTGTDGGDVVGSTTAVEQAYLAMTLSNDEALKDAPTTPSWSLHGNVIQGVPHGEAAPDYWVDEIKASGDASIQQHTQGGWSALTSWFVVYPGENNQADNIQVAIGDINMWVLHADSAHPNSVADADWVQVMDAAQPSWAGNYNHDLINYHNENHNMSAEHGYHLYHLDQYLRPVHGGTNIQCIVGHDSQGSCIKPENVLGVFMQVKAWLVEPQPDTKVMLSVGVDYYPNETVSTSQLTGVHYLPGAGGSRYQYLSEQPQWFYMSNVTDPTLIDSRGNYFFDGANAHTRAGGKTYLTKQELLSNPPPVSED